MIKQSTLLPDTNTFLQSTLTFDKKWVAFQNQLWHEIAFVKTQYHILDRIRDQGTGCVSYWILLNLLNCFVLSLYRYNHKYVQNKRPHVKMLNGFCSTIVQCFLSFVTGLEEAINTSSSFLSYKSLIRIRYNKQYL